jgi:hypothetical protein
LGEGRGGRQQGGQSQKHSHRDRSGRVRGDGEGNNSADARRARHSLHPANISKHLDPSSPENATHDSLEAVSRQTTSSYTTAKNDNRRCGQWDRDLTSTRQRISRNVAGRNEKVEAIASRREKPVLSPPLLSLATVSRPSEGGIKWMTESS